MRKIVLTERQRLDLEQILSGGFAPLTGFLTQTEYVSVIENMLSPTGSMWPMPIVLDVSEEHDLKLSEKVILCDTHDFEIATMVIASIYSPDKSKEARLVYGSNDMTHPGVRYLYNNTQNVYVGGPVTLIAYSPVPDFPELRFNPSELQAEFKKRGWERVVAFQTRNPFHRAHFEIMRRAMAEIKGHALIHPVAGITKEGDFDYVSRTRGYKRVYEQHLQDTAMLALLPIAMRMAGPREALWHALIRKNYGATHFIVGRDHAGPGNDVHGRPFYEPYAAQSLAHQFEKELGIAIVSMPEIVYHETEKRYVERAELGESQPIKSISGTELRRMLRAREEIPEWFSFPEVLEELRHAIEEEHHTYTRVSDAAPAIARI